MRPLLTILLFFLCLLNCFAQKKVPLGTSAVKRSAITEPTTRTFVNYNSTGVGGRELLFVFTEYQDAPNYFVGFRIEHVFDTSQEMYSDQFRIVYARLYRYQGGNMNNQSIEILTTGDCEGVFRREGAKDFSGGFHGDEKYNNFKVWLGSDTLEASETTFSLLPVDSFVLVQNSNVYLTGDSAQATDPTHPIVAEKYKKLTIKNGTYSVRTTYNWLDTTDISLMYHGIVTVDTTNAEYVYTETDPTPVYTVHDGSYAIDVHDGTRTVYYRNTSNGLGASVTSYIYTPSGQDAGAGLRVWDTDKYAKYYRSNYTNYTVYPGDVSDGFQKVIFSKQ